MQVCTPISLGCDVCFALSLAASNIKVMAGLVPATTPYIWITDKFGNQYKQQYTIAGDGSFTILPADFPSGMFTNVSGSFDVFVADVNGANVVAMTFSSVPYNCVKLSITC